MNSIYVLLSNTVLLLGNLIAKFYSRQREYRADKLAAHLVGPEAVIAALDVLRLDEATPPDDYVEYGAFKISNPQQLADVLSTHPSLEDRIQAIEAHFDWSSNERQ